MNKLQDIQFKIETRRNNFDQELEALQNEANRVFEKHMQSKLNEVQKIVNAAQESKELTQVECDEFYHTWSRVNFSKLIDLCNDFQKELLKTYFLEQYFIDLDFENDVASTSIGPAILINNEGDVLDQDSGQWFISKRDYETEEERNKLINEYMDKTGYYPSVIRCDYYGNAYFVNIEA